MYDPIKFAIYIIKGHTWPVLMNCCYFSFFATNRAGNIKQSRKENLATHMQKYPHICHIDTITPHNT